MPGTERLTPHTCSCCPGPHRRTGCRCLLIRKIVAYETQVSHPRGQAAEVGKGPGELIVVETQGSHHRGQAGEVHGPGELIGVEIQGSHHRGQAAEVQGPGELIVVLEYHFYLR